jgi:hypothetical protein
MTNMTAPPQLPTIRHTRIGVLRFSSIELLASLILLFAATPFVEDLPNGELIEAGLLTLVFILALLAVGGRRRTLIVSTALIVPAVVCTWLGHLHPPLVPHSLHRTFGLLFIAFVVMSLLRFILRAPRVEAEVLCAAVSAYLMLGLFWTLTYLMVAEISPDAFAFSTGPEASRTMNGFNAFYFSFATLSTVGYGDIAPVSKVARTLAVLEAITGMFYVTMLIARLVAMYSPGKSNDPPRDPDQP